MPRRQNAVWKFFDRVRKDGNCGPWAVCTKCHREMQGIVERLHKHYVKCWVGEVNCDSDADADTAEDNAASTSHQPELMNIAPSSRNESDELLMLPSEDTGSEYNANMKWKQKSDNKGTRKRAAPSMNIAKDSEVIVTSENYKKKD